MKNIFKKSAALFLAALLSISASTNVLAATDKSSNYNWDHVYMGCYGFVTGMVVHPKNPDLRYIRTDVGGMYKYDTQNNKWIQLMESISLKNKDLSAVRSIALDPTDENIIYAACGGSSGTTDIIKSTDGGKTWSGTGFFNKYGARCGNTRVARTIGESLVIDPVNRNIMFFGTERNGFYRSEDAGETWVKINDIPNYGWPTGGVAAIYIDPARQENGFSTDIYVSSWGYGVYKSTDGGKSFNLIKGSPRVPCRVQVVHGETDKMYVSSYNPNLTDYYSAGDDTGKVETDEIGSFYLYENGEWTDLHPVDKVKTPALYESFAQKTSFSAFMIDKRDPNVILLNSAPQSIENFFIFLSVDGGKSFERISRSTSATELLQVGDTNSVWMPYGGGVKYIEDFTTLSNKDQMINKDAGVETICVTKMASIPSENAPLVLIESQDHSLRVQEQLDVLAPDNSVEPTFNHGGGIDFCEEDPSFVFRTGVDGRHNFGEGTAAYSTDYGRTYTEVSGWDKSLRIVDCAVGAKKQKNGFPILMVLSVGRTGATENVNAADYGNGRGLYRSLDGGATWELMSEINVTRKKATNDYNNHIVASDRVNGNVFYYVETNILYRTTDGGKNWDYIDTINDFKDDGVSFEIPQYGAAIKAVPYMEGALWVKSTNGEVYTTYNFGRSWKNLGNIESTTYGCSFGFGTGEGERTVSVYNIGYIDGIFGVYFSNDLGNNWIKISPDGLNFFAGTIEVCGDRREYGRVFIGTGGTGVIYGEGNPTKKEYNYLPGEKFTVTASAYNSSSLEKKLTLFAAFYSNNLMKLMDVQMQQFTVPANAGETEFKLNVTIPDNAEDTILKVFAFFDNIQPLHEALEIKQVKE